MAIKEAKKKMSQGEREGPLQVDNHRICGLCREPVTAREESAGKREWSVQRLKTTKRVESRTEGRQ